MSKTIEDYIKEKKPEYIKQGMTEEEAEKKCRDEFSKKKELKIETAEMKNVEILETGTWNNLKVTESDLDEMVKHFQDKVLEPYLNLDHDDKYTDRVKRALSVVSLGFVSQLRREGKKLIANFTQVPRKVAELIDSGMLKKRSVEFFPRGFKVNGSTFNNVLKAVSFFGADIPAVNSLSNDFEVLLKSEAFAVNFSDETESEKILFTKTNGGKSMETIEISKKEHDELISFKTSASSDMATLQKEKEDLNVKLKAAEDKNAELEKLQKEIEEQKKADLQTEAEEFVAKIIKDGKLLPKFKDDKITDYISKAGDDARLKLFKEDLESRDKVINLGELKDENGEVVSTDIENLSSDEIDNAIKVKMKKDNVSYEEAAQSLGIDM
jgi:hypothetical protein